MPMRVRARRSVGRAKRMPSLARLVRILRAQLPEIRDRYGVKSLGVFGSYVRGEHKSHSDLDVLVEYADLFPATPRPDLKQELTELLKIKVDLVPLHLLKPFIGKHIRAEVIWLLRDGQILEAKIPHRRANGKRNGKMAKREYLDYLNDIVANMEMAEQFSQGVSNFQDLPEKAYALAKTIENIGEAVKRIPAEVRNKYPQVPWQRIAEMRAKIAHDYFEIDYEELWKVVTKDIPRDKPLVRQIIEEELERRRAQEKT